MPLTRAQVEKVLVGRCGKLLAAVGLDAETVDGTNAALAGPIVGALLDLGLVVADPSNPSDADLAPVGASQVAALLDLAHVRALEAVLDNWAEPDQMADTDNQQALGKLRDSLEKTVSRKRLQIERQYGIGVGSLTSGVLDLGFAETLDPATGWPR